MFGSARTNLSPGNRGNRVAVQLRGPISPTSAGRSRSAADCSAATGGADNEPGTPISQGGRAGAVPPDGAKQCLSWSPSNSRRRRRCFRCRSSEKLRRHYRCRSRMSILLAPPFVARCAAIGSASTLALINIVAW